MGARIRLRVAHTDAPRKHRRRSVRGPMAIRGKSRSPPTQTANQPSPVTLSTGSRFVPCSKTPLSATVVSHCCWRGDVTSPRRSCGGGAICERRLFTFATTSAIGERATRQTPLVSSAVVRSSYQTTAVWLLRRRDTRRETTNSAAPCPHQRASIGSDPKTFSMFAVPMRIVRHRYMANKSRCSADNRNLV